jgi:hypothetical protein
MAPSTPKHTLKSLLGHFADPDGRTKDPVVLEQIQAFRDPRVWRDLMEDAGLERATFVRTYNVARDDLLDRLAFSYLENGWRDQPTGALAPLANGDPRGGQRVKPRVDSLGYLGLFLLTAATTCTPARSGPSRAPPRSPSPPR